MFLSILSLKTILPLSVVCCFIIALITEGVFPLSKILFVKLYCATIVCAAKSKVLPGDYYLDDNIHYILAVDLEVLRCVGINGEGADLWEFCSMPPKEATK